MKQTIDQLESILATYPAKLKEVAEDDYAVKPAPAKWSRKEILGHLSDSAQNNIRRFLIAQYEEQPHILYNQDKWVAFAGYQQWPVGDLIDLWVLLNKHICSILRNLTPENGQRICLTREPHTVEWLAADYVKHLLHHLHQVLLLEPVDYP